MDRRWNAMLLLLFQLSLDRLVLIFTIMLQLQLLTSTMFQNEKRVVVAAFVTSTSTRPQQLLALGYTTTAHRWQGFYDCHRNHQHRCCCRRRRRHYHHRYHHDRTTITTTTTTNLYYLQRRAFASSNECAMQYNHPMVHHVTQQEHELFPGHKSRTSTVVRVTSTPQQHQPDLSQNRISLGQHSRLNALTTEQHTLFQELGGTMKALEDHITTLNNGIVINCNSRDQVSKAIFGTVQTATKQVLREIQNNPSINQHGQELAKYILLWKEMQPTRSRMVSTSERIPFAESESTEVEVAIPLTKASDIISQQSKSSIELYPILEDNLQSATSIDNNEFSPFQQQVGRLFAKCPEKMIDDYWKIPLLQLQNPTAQRIVGQLRSYDPLGYNPVVDNKNANTLSATEEMNGYNTKESSQKFLKFCRDQKSRRPDCIILARCGDFYETFGVDAILLMEHCGLNPMGEKARAGCPKNNIRQTLDGLTSAGFRVAVYEEGADTGASTGRAVPAGGKIKHRFLSEIVCPANPSYTYKFTVSKATTDVMSRSPDARPYVGILSTSMGYTLAEVSMEQRTVLVSERLTAEAVACRLSAYPPADPLFYVPSPSESESSSTPILPFLPSGFGTLTKGSQLRIRRIDPELVLREGQGLTSNVERTKNIIVSELLHLSEGETDDPESTRQQLNVDDFVAVLASSGKQFTQPLHLDTATQLGLMNDKAIPSIVSYLLPASAPVATRRLLTRLLLVPPPPDVGKSMANLVSYFRNDSCPALPSLSVPPLGKVLATLHTNQASAEVFSGLLKAMDSVVKLLDILKDDAQLSNSLMTLVEYQTGMSTSPVSLKIRCQQAKEVIEAVLSSNHHVDSKSNCDIEDNSSAYGNIVPPAFFTRNEDVWRGHVCREAAPNTYSDVNTAAANLANAIANDFWCMDRTTLQDDSLKRSPVFQDIFDNSLYIKQIPEQRKKDPPADTLYFHPFNRNGKKQTTRYTTANVQRAMVEYLEACEKACDDVSTVLVALSRRIHDDGHLPAIVQASHLNLIISVAIHHATKANALGWNMANVVDYADHTTAGTFNTLWPYWFSRFEAVENTFDLNGMWLLTAPNMSGKSTLMRSTAAAALLSVCGLCAPLEKGSIVRRFDHLFVRAASSDIPSERKSAFGAEMSDVSVLLRCCGEKSLVFVDELGRGTSPRDGTRLAGALVEKMAMSGINGMFSTHLHDINWLPLKPEATRRIVQKRMAVRDSELSASKPMLTEWKYKVEDGICTDSMALVTAERFGLPRDVIERAEEFSRHLPAAGILESAPPRRSTPDMNRFSPTLLTLNDAINLSEGLTGSNATIVPPGYTVPASFAGKSALYILKLDSNRPLFYVGQTDNFHQRLKQHRCKPGKQWTNLEAVALPVSNKSKATRWERVLIQEMVRRGFSMVSTNDGTNVRF